MQDARIPRLTGILNFRDLGGYATRDGRVVRWNRLYRSAALHRMTVEDRGYLTSLGIRYAYDLRSSSERTGQPSRIHELPDLVYRAADHDEMPGDIPRLMRSRKLQPAQSQAIMLDLYRQLPQIFRGAYAELFQHMAAGELPLLFNCAAGKDRTGVAAALVLTALGVPRELVIEDYLLTEQFFEQTCAYVRNGPYANLFTEADRAIWEPFVRADATYLQAMFDYLDVQYGGVSAYLRDELGLTPAMETAIRDQLLE
jgi:protein-tyrosine phosphatase